MRDCCVLPGRLTVHEARIYIVGMCYNLCTPAMLPRTRALQDLEKRLAMSEVQAKLLQGERDNAVAARGEAERALETQRREAG